MNAHAVRLPMSLPPAAGLVLAHGPIDDALQHRYAGAMVAVVFGDAGGGVRGFGPGGAIVRLPGGKGYGGHVDPEG